MFLLLLHIIVVVVVIVIVIAMPSNVHFRWMGCRRKIARNKSARNPIWYETNK